MFIHVGLHKTGTTYIQEEVFRKISNSNYSRDPFFFKEIKGMVNIISNEWLSGRPYHPYASEDDRYVIGKRLANMYPYAKIIIGIRDPETWTRSLYLQYIKKGGIHTFEQWLEQVFNREMLRTDAYIDFLNKYFKDVYIYTFEEFIKDKKSCINDLCTFLECESPAVINDKRHNRSWSKAQISIVRTLNKLFISEMNTKGIIRWRTYLNPRTLIEHRGFSRKGIQTPYWRDCWKQGQ